MVDNFINQHQNRNIDDYTVPLFLKIIESAHIHAVDVVVCLLTNDEPTIKLKDFLVSKNIKVIDFSEIWYDETYSCLPKDNHPNYKAHKAFADSIFQYLNSSNSFH